MFGFPGFPIHDQFPCPAEDFSQSILQYDVIADCNTWEFTGRWRFGTDDFAPIYEARFLIRRIIGPSTRAKCTGGCQGLPFRAPDAGLDPLTAVSFMNPFTLLA